MARLPVLLTGGVLVAALGAGALGVAAAAAPDPSPSPSAASPAVAPSAKTTGKKAGVGLAQRALHGEFAVRTKGGFTTIALQRGQVTAVSAKMITLRSVDGFSRMYLINADTTVHAQGTVASLSAVQVGERAMIRAVRSGSTYTATRIGGLRTGQAGKAGPPVPSAS